MKKIGLISLMIVACVSACMAGEKSMSSTATNLAVSVAFNPQETPIKVNSLYAKGGDAAANLELYQRTGSPETVTATPTNGATVIYVDNADSQFASSDSVVYVYSDRADPLFTTLSAATTTNITLATAIGQAGNAADKVYEVTADTIFIGTTAFNPAGGGLIYVTGGDSPFVAKVTETATNSLLATVNW